jgi:hypothetical protein
LALRLQRVKLRELVGASRVREGLKRKLFQARAGR